MSFTRHLSVAFSAVLFIAPFAAHADGCSDEHVLEATVTDTVCLSLDDLKEIGETDISTSTLWTEGVHDFKGVSLVALIDHLKASGSEIEATAINDYAVTIPTSDAVEGGPIIAYEMDGKPMSRRDKGPLWVIYPFDDSAKYRTETIYSRSIWQLNRIKFIE